MLRRILLSCSLIPIGPVCSISVCPCCGVGSCQYYCSAERRANINDQCTEHGSQDTFSQSFVKLKIVHFPNRYFFMFWQDTVKATRCPLLHWLVLHHSRFYAFGCLSSITVQISQQTCMNAEKLLMLSGFPFLSPSVD